jgi:hypothetical protein
MNGQTGQQYYWLLTLKDGEQIKVKPDAVEAIKQRYAKKEPLVTGQRVIPFSEMKDFGITSEIYNPRALNSPNKLEEDAARAFNEPMLNPDGSVICRWVKKDVPRNKWDNYYSKMTSYELVSQDDSWITMASFTPVHSINEQEWNDCTEDEVIRLEQKRKNIGGR